MVIKNTDFQDIECSVCERNFKFVVPVIMNYDGELHQSVVCIGCLRRADINVSDYGWTKPSV